MNTLDIVILLLFIPGIIRGMSKGFLEQIITLVGIVLSAYLAFKFSDVAGRWLGNYLQVSQTLLNILSFTLVLAGVLLVTLFFAKLLTAAVENISLGWLNKVLGLVSAIATSAVIIGLIIILFDTVNTKFGLVKSPVLQASLLYGALKDFGDFVFPYIKQLLSLTS